jgi:hypothetical protein
MRSKSKISIFFWLGAMTLPVFGDCGATMAQLRANQSAHTPPIAGTTVADAQAPDLEFWGADPESGPIVGLWDIKFLADGQVVDEGFDIWHSDKTETLNDTPPPATGNVCLGVWTRTGRNRFKLKHPSWLYDEATNTQIIGQAIIREEVMVGRSGNTFAGTYSVDILDTSGNLLEHLEGHVKATRITPD